MRLHSLEATAFGPFTDTVRVDFDRLSAAGLFLLSGATGAGKTSVLDAVCFALYGDVPGDRATAKRLRADLAAADVATRVVLEATLSGRRFRLTRSPAWERPKKRGTGTTTQQPSVLVQERVDGAWTTHTTRLDEAGDLVGALLGMTLGQFTQVALLPQGRFQAFLRARSEERKDLLQRLFDTHRFADVERWLRDRRLALRRRSDDVHQEVADVVSRISEAAGLPLPDGWDAADLALPAGDGSVSAWAEGLVADARAAHEKAAALAADTRTSETAARTALDAGRALTERRERIDAAAAEHADLAAAAEEHDLAVAALDAARRAAPVVPLVRLAERARRLHEDALAAAPADRDLVAARATADDARERVGSARGLLPRAERLAVVVRERAAANARRETAAEQLLVATERADALPAEIAALRSEVDAAREAERSVALLRGRLAAYDLVDGLTADLTEAKELHLEARGLTVDAKEALVAVRQARLDSMAAELAGALAVGASCPVCGSADHPHKAVPAPGSPDAAAEKAAQRQADDAAAVELARAERVRELTTRLEIAVDQAGPADDRTTVEADLTRDAAVADTLGARDRTLRAAESESEQVAARCRSLGAQAADLEASLRHLDAEHDELTGLLEQALDGTGADDLATLVASLDAASLEATTAVERLEALTRAEQGLIAADADLATACDEHDFASADDAVAAALEPAVADELTATVKHHERRLAHVTGILQEPGTAEVAAAELPDLDALAADHASALEAFSAAQGAVTGCVTALARLADLESSLAGLLERWGPLRSELELATRLASFAEGKSADNQLQMSLSAYVVAYRLTQVVASANERLATMSDQRYSLEHSAQRGAGDRRGGLSLLVRDDWSGEARDPATLSGGETFVVSLALALGLADVISHEAGGAMLDTLFVDEGFGSLDADTLDDVLDVLDGLRDGGRVVGVVSHVGEMRDRIPTRLLVDKRRGGSTLRVEAAAG